MSLQCGEDLHSPRRWKKSFSARSHTHARTAAAGYLPLRLINARFICVSQCNTVGALVEGFTRFYCHLGSERKPVYLPVLQWCLQRIVSHMLLPVVYYVILPKCLWSKIFGVSFLNDLMNFVNEVSMWRWASIPLVGALCTLRYEGVWRVLTLTSNVKNFSLPVQVIFFPL